MYTKNYPKRAFHERAANAILNQPASRPLRTPVQKAWRNQRVRYLVKTTKIQNNARTAVVKIVSGVLHCLSVFLPINASVLLLFPLLIQ
jgi:hypothetical protein